MNVQTIASAALGDGYIDLLRRPAPYGTRHVRRMNSIGKHHGLIARANAALHKDQSAQDDVHFEVAGYEVLGGAVLKGLNTFYGIH